MALCVPIDTNTHTHTHRTRRREGEVRRLKFAKGILSSLRKKGRIGGQLPTIVCFRTALLIFGCRFLPYIETSKEEEEGRKEREDKRDP